MTLLRTPIPLLVLLVAVLSGCHRHSLPVASDPAMQADAEPARTTEFAFEVHGHRLVGLLDTPAHRTPVSTIILVHGYGKTNVVEKNGYADLRAHFSRIGMNVLVWDKPGLGRSGGEFDINQSVASSAEEVVAAVHALKARGIPGSERIGLWGISRAGWIAPLAIQSEPAIDFWISVSGVDDQENARYLLSANLPLEGRSADETTRLIDAWQRSFDATWRGQGYPVYLQAATVLSEDPFLQFMGWGQPVTEEAFNAYQEQFTRGELRVDEESGLAIYVPGFREVLSALDLPVLALFGNRDTNVDWRKTMALYQETIGANAAADLSVRVFVGANHNLRQAETGGIREMYGQSRDTPYAEGYLDTMADWLVTHGFASRSP